MTRIASRADVGGVEYRENAANMAALVAELKRRQALAATGGGEEARAKHVADYPHGRSGDHGKALLCLVRHSPNCFSWRTNGGLPQLCAERIKVHRTGISEEPVHPH